MTRPGVAHPAARWASLATSDPSRPFVTCYDDARDERVELSVATADNWVAKTANLLVDDVAAEPGDRLALLLPAHWRTACVALAAWSAGLVVVPAGDLTAGTVRDVDIAVTDDQPAGVATGAATVVLVALPALARSAGPQPAARTDVIDYNADVLAHGDRFFAVAPWEPAAEVLPGRSGADLLAAAALVVDRHGLDGASRLLTTRGVATADDLFWTLLVPLVAGCGFVTSIGRPPPAALAWRARQERVTATVGCDLTWLPRLDPPDGG